MPEALFSVAANRQTYSIRKSALRRLPAPTMHLRLPQSMRQERPARNLVRGAVLGALLCIAGAAFAAAGAADAEVWGLKKSASVFFAGDADAAALAAGLAAASILAFRVRFAFGEAAGDSAAEAVFSAEGDSAGVGDCACKSEIAAKLMTETTKRDLVLMNTSVVNRQNGRQDICHNIMAVPASFGLPTYGCSV